MLLNISLISGIALGKWLPFCFFNKTIFLFIIIIILGLGLLLVWSYKKIRIIILVGCFFILGLWRFSLSLPIDSLNKIWHYNNQEINLIGKVIKEPVVSQTKQQITIKVEKKIQTEDKDKEKKEEEKEEESQDKENQNISLDGLLLMITKVYPQYEYGDRVYLKCKLQAPQVFNDFAYDQYLARYHIYSVCYYPEIELIESHLNFFDNSYQQILRFKYYLGSQIDKNLNYQEASLVKAIFLGYKKDITKEWRQKFSQVGLSHIVAISGLHISIISLLLFQILLAIGLSRRYIFYIVSIILWLYIIVIGLPASAIRAGIMGWLVLWSVYLGRLNKSINIFVLTASIMLLINPLLFWNDIGWQLSFLAVLGIIYLYPLIQKYLKED